MRHFVQVLFTFGVTLSLATLTLAWIPSTWNGRPAEGLPSPSRILDDEATPPPEEQFYEFQKVSHFDGTLLKNWKQRYYVNNATYSAGGPIFLVLGGNSAADPAWIQQGSAPYEYARQHGALLVQLEHRYYGKSQPVPNLSATNLRYLSSREALADTAAFVTYYRWWNHVANSTKLVVFGASYAGSLAVWFREKYPYLCDGAVASSPMIVAQMDFKEFFEGAADVLDMTGPQCRAEVHNATETMFDWYGQPEKRLEMHKMFRLCEKIDYSMMIDLNVLFNNLAQQWADIVQFNNINRSIEGLPAESVSVKMACDVMTDMARGSSVQRYADVSNLYLDMRQKPCLNVRYRDLVKSMNYTMWNSTGATGSRQWLYQSCSEFGWFLSSDSFKQPFGAYLYFPWNLTTDQCIQVFQRIFGGEEVIDNCQETNLYYGGLDLAVSHVAFVNGGADPWRAASVTKPLKNSPNADIILIPDTGHCADMYPPSDTDPVPLTQARQQISQLIAKWIH